MDTDKEENNGLPLPGIESRLFGLPPHIGINNRFYLCNYESQELKLNKFHLICHSIILQ
jgi:hypothetical protein